MNSFEENKPIIPRDSEIEIGIHSNFYIKLNDKQHIDYINSDFCNVSSYEDYELIDETFVSIWHPDMPNVLYEILFETVNKREKTDFIIKMIAKDGRYFWVHTVLDAKINDYGEIVGYYIHCKPISKFAVKEIASFLYILKKIEERSNNTKVSRRYLIGFLEERKTTLTNFVIKLTEAYPVSENSTFYGNDNGYQPFRSSQNAGNTFGNYGAQQSTLQEQKPEAKKSLFQRIFGSKN